MEKFSLDLQVRYSECDGDRTVALHQILNYFQDCTTLQSEVIGYGIDNNIENKRAWFLLAYDIRINRMPVLFENIRIITDPYLMKRYYGYRRFYVQDQEGEVLITGDSIWILMDVEHMLPMAIPEDMARAFVPEPSQPGKSMKRKIRPKDEWTLLEEFDIADFFLDTNHHVNNQYYIMWMQNALKGMDVSRIRIDYRKAALPGDHLIMYRQDQENKLIIKYENSRGELLAFVECFGKPEKDKRDADTE